MRESKNFWISLDGIGYAVEICWSDEPHTQFISSNQYLRERTEFTEFGLKSKQASKQTQRKEKKKTTTENACLHLAIDFYYSWYDKKKPHYLSV